MALKFGLLKNIYQHSWYLYNLSRETNYFRDILFLSGMWRQRRCFMLLPFMSSRVLSLCNGSLLRKTDSLLGHRKELCGQLVQKHVLKHTFIMILSTRVRRKLGTKMQYIFKCEHLHLGRAGINCLWFINTPYFNHPYTISQEVTESISPLYFGTQAYSIGLGITLILLQHDKVKSIVIIVIQGAE